MMHATPSGDFYAFINRVKGRVVELVPLDPSRVRVVSDEASQAKRFEFRASSGAVEAYAAADIWHVKGPSWDTIKGLGAVSIGERGDRIVDRDRGRDLNCTRTALDQAARSQSRAD